MNNHPTQRQASALTSVFWDINLCRVPNDFDPRRVRPCIKRFLENRGYSGPVNITAAGVLANVPTEILRGVFSSGISLTNVRYGYGSYDTSDVIFAFTEENPPSSSNIMVIADPKIFTGVSNVLNMIGYHLLLPCPFDSLQSLLLEQEEGMCIVAPDEETVESTCWDCLVCCRDPPGHVFENFLTHLYGEEHQQMVSDLLPLNNNHDAVQSLPPIDENLVKETLMTWDWFPPVAAPGPFYMSAYYETMQEAETFVFWDINTYPVPSCSDAPRVGPCIKRFLAKAGYFGPFIIIAVGALTDVPVDILRGVSSSGITLTNLPYGSSDLNRLLSEFTIKQPVPANLMVISTTKISPLKSRYLLEIKNHNLMQPFPYASLQCFLSANSGALEEDKCSETGESAYWFCSVCYPGIAYKGFDNFATHLSSEQHRLKLLDVLPKKELPEKNKEAVTMVFWDIKMCPVPSRCDPSLVGPSIKRFLEKSGYTGPLTITAVGVLTDVPNDILRGVYSGGISLDNDSYGSSSIDDRVYDYTSENPPPANIVVICDPKICEVTFEYLSLKGGYDLLQYASIESFLPAVSGELEGGKCSEMGESACCVCSDCCRDGDDVEKDFEKFSTHLSSRAHRRKMLDFLPSKARFSRQEDASYHGGGSSKGKKRGREQEEKEEEK